MSSRHEHPLFGTHPLTGTAVLSSGETVSTPYHIYDGTILLVGGTADAGAARHLLRREHLTPLLDTAGRALMAVWVCDFTDAHLGAHHELQLSIFAAYRPLPPVRAHRFAIYRLLSVEPATMMICHGLWNSTPLVVTYNREVLGLDARLSVSELDLAAGRFRVKDAASGQPIAAGELPAPHHQPGADLRQMVSHVGLRGMLRQMRSPFVQVPVVNPITDHLPENWIARTYTKTDRQLIRSFDTARDRLTITHPEYAPLDFQPMFVQHGFGVRFVYHCPQPPQG